MCAYVYWRLLCGFFCSPWWWWNDGGWKQINRWIDMARRRQRGQAHTYPPITHTALTAETTIAHNFKVRCFWCAHQIIVQFVWCGGGTHRQRAFDSMAARPFWWSRRQRRLIQIWHSHPLLDWCRQVMPWWMDGGMAAAVTSLLARLYWTCTEQSSSIHSMITVSPFAPFPCWQRVLEHNN